MIGLINPFEFNDDDVNKKAKKKTCLDMKCYCLQIGRILWQFHPDDGHCTCSFKAANELEKANHHK